MDIQGEQGCLPSSCITRCSLLFVPVYYASWAVETHGIPPKSHGHPRSPSPWQKGAKKGKPQADKRPAFPAYDTIPIADGKPQADGKGQALVRMEESGEGQLVPTVQRALNGARKAENKLARLIKDKDRAQLQWTQYLQDSQKAYIREKARHRKALEHYEKEIQDAKEQQKHARLLLRQVAFQEEDLMDVEEEAEEEDDDWRRTRWRTMGSYSGRSKKAGLGHPDLRQEDLHGPRG